MNSRFSRYCRIIAVLCLANTLERIDNEYI